MRIALASCSDLPEWEVDDRPLHAALTARGCEWSTVPWDDPDFDWHACAACLIRTTWDYMERRDEFLAWAGRVASGTRLFNPLEIVQWNTHKSYLRDLEAGGALTVPTVWLDVGADVDLERILGGRGWNRAFLKPVVGATRRETLRFDADAVGIAEARRHLRRLLAREPMMLQPYLGSVEREGEMSAIVIDGEITHAVRKIPVPGDYRVQDDHGGTDEPVALSEPERLGVHQILQRVPVDLLYARADFLRDEAGRLRLNELELVEPSLFFRHGPHAAGRLADALLHRLG